MSAKTGTTRTPEDGCPYAFLSEGFQKKAKTPSIFRPISERETDAQRPEGVLRGGRLEIGVGKSDLRGSPIDFAVSASPKPVLW